MTAHLRVVEPGPLLLVEDAGRPGLASLGVGASGAFDRAAHRLGNRLVGNPPDAAGLEVLLGGAVLETDAECWVAVTGAWGPVTYTTAGTETARAHRVEPHTATLLPAGARLELAPVQHGVRSYLAVRGGIDAAPVLGSRSRDTLAALGPAPLRAGDVLELGSTPEGAVPAADLVPVDPPADGPVRLDLAPGPRRDWFSAASNTLLAESVWTVSSRSDRTGIRLDGPPLERTREGELPSEGMLPGAIQVSPDGSPTVLGVDGPVTGGYPVIAVVADRSLDLLAQLRPGQSVLFSPRALRP